MIFSYLLHGYDVIRILKLRIEERGEAELEFEFEMICLRMSATGRSYLQNFLKVQKIIIQAILSRKSMKEF